MAVGSDEQQVMALFAQESRDALRSLARFLQGETGGDLIGTQIRLRLLQDALALIGFLLLWLTSYDVMFRRMGWAAWKKLHNGMYVLLALGLLHFCHLGKPLCWLDWLEGVQTQSCVRDGRIPPLSFILFLGIILLSVLRLIEPLARQPAPQREDDG